MGPRHVHQASQYSELPVTTSVRANERANDREALLSVLLRQFPHGSVNLLDTDLRFLVAEGKPLGCCGCSTQELAGRPFGQFLPRSMAEYVRSQYQRALAGQEISFEIPFRDSVYAIRAGPIFNDRGDVIAVNVITDDVTERRREEQAQHLLVEANSLLAASADYGQALAEVAKLVVPFHADWCLVGMRDGEQLQWLAVANADPALAAKMHARLIDLGPIPPGIARLLSSGEPTLIATLSQERLRDLATSRAQSDALREMGPRSAIFAPLRGHDRSLGGFWFVSSASRAGGMGRRFGKSDLKVAGELAQIAALAVENALLRAEAVEHERRLQDLIGQILVAQEEERRWIACDIHDQLAQVASCTYQHVQALAHEYHPRSAPARAALMQALELSRTTVREARRLVAGLRPTMLDDFGLAAAIGRLIDDLRAGGWEVVYEDQLGAERLPSALEIAFFRVAQEALSNIRKHAGTTRIHVTLSRSGRLASLTVRDWGRGFEAHALPAPGESGFHVGLVGMRERMALVGGRCKVTSHFGEGTRVVATVPLPPSSEGGSA
jgi:signal transduction histidine kinase